MKQYLGLLAAILALGLASCGYPDFTFGNVGGGGAGTITGVSSSSSAASSSSTTGATSSSSSAAASSSSSAAASSSSGVSCPIEHLLIGEIRSRGAAGAGDEFIALYNPMSGPTVLDASWTLRVRSTSALGYDTRWTGDGSIIPAHGHYLIAGAAYTQSPPPDGLLASGITDAGSIVLAHGTTNVDVLCYAYGPYTSSVLSNVIDPYTCAGTPATNPHDDSSGTDADVSLARRPGGVAGNCTDTMDNAYDFIQQKPATPAGLGSLPAP